MIKFRQPTEINELPFNVPYNNPQHNHCFTLENFLPAEDITINLCINQR